MIYAVPTNSTLLFWTALIALGMSVIFGLLYFMRGIGMLSVDRIYNVYTPILRVLSICQIFLVLLGIILVCFLIGSPTRLPGGVISIQHGESSINYPQELKKNYKIEINDAGISFNAVD